MRMGMITATLGHRNTSPQVYIKSVTMATVITRYLPKPWQLWIFLWSRYPGNFVEIHSYIYFVEQAQNLRLQN